MLQMEISQEIIAKTDTEVKLNLADDVCRLLQVREKNIGMQKDWLLFISTSNFKVTAGEIYLAFRMALSREILDDKGNEIDLFPELSNNTTGKVIAAYIRYKEANSVYQSAKENLKKLCAPKNDFTEADKETLRQNYLISVFNDLQENGFSNIAYHLYQELIDAKKIEVSDSRKKEVYKKQLQLFMLEEKRTIKTKDAIVAKNLLKELQRKIDSGVKFEYVKNQSKSFIVSEYLKGFLTFEEFKKALL